MTKSWRIITDNYELGHNFQFAQNTRITLLISPVGGSIPSASVIDGVGSLV